MTPVWTDGVFGQSFPNTKIGSQSRRQGKNAPNIPETVWEGFLKTSISLHFSGYSALMDPNTRAGLWCPQSFIALSRTVVSWSFLMPSLTHEFLELLTAEIGRASCRDSGWMHVSAR